MNQLSGNLRLAPSGFICHNRTVCCAFDKAVLPVATALKRIADIPSNAHIVYGIMGTLKLSLGSTADTENKQSQKSEVMIQHFTRTNIDF